MELLWLTIYLITLTRSFALNFSEDCISQKTYDYWYRKFHSVNILNQLKNRTQDKSFYFEFYVKAVSDAHVLLANSDSIDSMSAYEIVIGGGKNSFSQIRLYPDKTKTAQPTLFMLSPVEYKKFWIRVTNEGIIMVGKSNTTTPFIFWIDVQPFPIRYFAFSTWTNVKGEWYFNCKEKSNSDPEHSEVEVNMTSLQRLKNDLLTPYNPTVIPQRDGSAEEKIEMHLEATYFYLDEKKGQLTVHGMADVKWTDWKLRWNASDYEGIDYMFLTPYQVWTPGIRVINSLAVEKKVLLSLSGGVFVTKTGNVSWRVPFHSVTLCALGYTNWPFDAHNCSLVFGFLTEPLKIYVKDMVVSRISKSEWEIQKMNGKDLIISHVEDFTSVVNIFFRRREPSYEFLMLPPFFGAAVLTLAAFWLYPNSSAKLFLNCGTILLLILMLMILGERVPTAASDVPKIVHMYSSSILIMCVPVLLFIGLKYIPSSIHLPRMLSALINSTLVEILFFLPESQSSYSNLRNQEEGSISAIRLVTLIERFVFLIYLTVSIVPFVGFVTKFDVFNI